LEELEELDIFELLREELSDFEDELE